MRRVLLGTVILLGMALVTPPPAMAEKVLGLQHPVSGIATLPISDCSWDVPPPDLAVCTDWYISYGKYGWSGEPAQRRGWIASVYQVHYRYHADIDDIEVLWDRYGESADVTGYVDTQHLETAQVSGTVPMSDGGAIELDLTWDMTGEPTQVAGIDGPIEEEGTPWGTTYGDRCITQNFLSHQRWRNGGQISGTIDETDVATLLIPAGGLFINGQSVFIINVTEHAPSCGASRV